MSQTIIGFNHYERAKDHFHNQLFKHDQIPIPDEICLRLSHVALVAKATEKDFTSNPCLERFYKEGPGLYVFESTTGNVDWSGVSGVQINTFEKWIEMYDGLVWARQWQEKPKISNTLILTAMKDLVGTPYESGIMGLSTLATSFNDGIVLDTPQLYCTESGVIIDKQAGFIHEDANPQKFPPYRWGTGGKIERYCNVKLGPMVPVKFEGV
jgi:hypothetical protein